MVILWIPAPSRQYSPNQFGHQRVEVRHTIERKPEDFRAPVLPVKSVVKDIKFQFLF